MRRMPLVLLAALSALAAGCAAVGPSESTALHVPVHVWVENGDPAPGRYNLTFQDNATGTPVAHVLVDLGGSEPRRHVVTLYAGRDLLLRVRAEGATTGPVPSDTPIPVWWTPEHRTAYANVWLTLQAGQVAGHGYAACLDPPDPQAGDSCDRP